MEKDLTNIKFGKLLVLRKDRKIKKHLYWLCKCECGNYVVKRSDCLNNNSSCGCYTNTLKALKSHTRTHGLWGHDLYKRYWKIKQRCYNPKQKYYCNYGGRGITMCSEWLDPQYGFKSFYNWSLTNGYKKELTIDRIDNNKGYSPQNCRWITKNEQELNKRNNRNFTWNGETHCIAEWARILGFSRDCLYYRLVIKKWDIGKAMTTPSQRRLLNGYSGTME